VALRSDGQQAGRRQDAVRLGQQRAGARIRQQEERTPGRQVFRLSRAWQWPRC